MTSTVFEAGVNLAKISVGTGILALPYATVNSGGLLLSPILNAGIAVLNGMFLANYCSSYAHFSINYLLLMTTLRDIIIKLIACMVDFTKAFLQP